MIPLKIQIKNFLSYGPEAQEIDFTQYQMICLSGKNGHGKSALLDAMTWAVWGQARKSSGQAKPDHGLLHLGERNMRVVFDFEFNQKYYRVRREFTFAYGKPTAYLEFGMFANQDFYDQQSEIICLTDKTIRKTQFKIELLIGLDFDSFINSAFIRQGNAGEFSQKSPKERKEIVGNILGLSIYDKLRKSASDRAKTLEGERQLIFKLYERLANDLEQLNQVESLVQNLQNKLTEIKHQKNSCESKVQSCYQEQSALELKILLQAENMKQLLDLQQSYTQGLTKIKLLKSAWHDLLIKLNTFTDKEKLETRKIELINQINSLRHKQKNSWELREQLAALKADYQKNELDLLAAHDQKINQIKLLIEKNQANLAYARTDYVKNQQGLTDLLLSQAQLAKKLQSFDCQQIEHDQLQKKFERYKDFYQRLIVMGNIASQQQADVANKKIYLEKDCPACPLCSQALTIAHKNDLTSQFNDQFYFAQNRVLRVGKLLKDLKVKIYDQHNLLTKYKEDLAQAKIWQAQQMQDQFKIDDLKNLLLVNQAELEKNDQVMQDLKKSLDQLIQQRLMLLEQDEVSLKILQKIKQIESQLQLINYSQDRLDLAEQELTSLNNLLASAVQDDLLTQRAKILQQVSDLIIELKNKKKLIYELKLLFQQEPLEIKKEQLGQLLLNLNRTYQDLSATYDTVLQQLGSAQQQLEKLEKTKSELINLKADLAKLELEVQDYKSLVMAFGKDGIQALLIEEAIPEIEQEANYLLGKLTDNQAQLFIESLRDLKSGGTKETLDIKISDNVGLRPYEMFSGGEAFRIDFALRIAISKLLAKRAGTALQTLIIDEGFGSQDEEGLAHIMDALYKIQDDFAKIIIVSHLNTMKEQFPVHFFINKTLTGSTVSVIEQG